MARYFVFVLSLVVIIDSPLHSSDDLWESPFSRRFPAAFSHYSPFADVAAKGGASGASPFGSSFNLAGIAWSFQPEEFDHVASANYGFLNFDAGTEINLNTQTLAFEMEDLGIFRFALVEFLSNNSPVRGAPVRYDFDLLGSRLDWSKRMGDCGFGAGLGFTNAETLFSTPLLRLSDSERDLLSGRLSIQRQFRDHWLVGVTADYGTGRNDILRETAPDRELRSLESSHQWVAQTGVAYQITPKTAAHLDYQFAHFADETGELDLHRVSAGTDIPMGDRVILRAGAATDQWGNVGFTSGLALVPRTGTTLSLAYQNAMTPELDREFGKSQLFNFSISVKW